MISVKEMIRVIIGAMGLASLAQPTLADGFFMQTDAGRDTRSFVTTVAKGPWNFGLNLSDYEGGSSAITSVTYAFPLGEVAVLKLGPSIGLLRENGGWGDPEPGVKLSLDRYAATPFGSVYGLLELNSIDAAWFVLAQLTLQQQGLSFELSDGGSDSYRETTIAVQKKVSDGPASLRFGYKLRSEEVFIGFNINTF